MNRNDAKRIAETITNEQIQEMFNNAKVKITDWTKVSNCNKGCTKGVVWNILAKDFDVTTEHRMLAKINMIHEFGEYLPEELKPKKSYHKHQPPMHQDPQF